MATHPRTAPHDAQRPRQTLSLSTWRGRNCSKLAGGEQFPNSPELDPAQRFEHWLWSERNSWSIAQHARGMFGDGKLIDKRRADQLLRRELAALADGGDA